MISQPLNVRIFLSSPGDVADERGIAFKLLEQIPYDPVFRDKVVLQAVAWDKIGADAPLFATMTPQEAINQGLPKPSECDIVVVIFWSRMGTPLPASYSKPDGTRYLSGTEWEYWDAYQVAKSNTRPFLLVYRRMEEPVIGLRDPQRREKLEQYERVEAFFQQFVGPQGELLSGYNAYSSPEEFRLKLEGHLKSLILRFMEAPPPAFSDKVPPLKPLWEGSPFPGLRSFTPADAPIFFGRGVETDALLKRVTESHFVAVVGASGSGKSSLVGAGLLPRLASNAIQGSKDWLLPEWSITSRQWSGGYFMPGEVGDNPFLALALKLAPLLRDEPQALADALQAEPASIVSIAQRILFSRPSWAELVLFIDQFEELFTLNDAQYVVPFIELLTAARTGRIRIVATCRADFYAQCIEVPALATLLKNATFPLANPEISALYEMIIQPAARAGLTYEAGLAERILRDTGTEPGALALMAYALDELYRASGTEGQLSHHDYEAMQGVQGAIGERAENTYKQLDAETQASLPQVFRQLCEVDERGVALRRRASFQEVVRTVSAQRLVAALIEKRLLVTDRNAANQVVIEVAHEALMTNWPRLTEWIASTEEELQLLRQVRLNAEEWERSGRNPIDLMSGSKLERARVWASDDRLTPLYCEYLDSSLRAEEQRKRAQKFSRYSVVTLIALLVIVITGFLVIQNQAQRERIAEQETIASTLSHQSTAVAQERDRADMNAATSAANAAIANRQAMEAQSIALAAAAQSVNQRDQTDAIALAVAANQLDNPPALSQLILSEVAYQPGVRRVFTGNIPAGRPAQESLGPNSESGELSDTGNSDWNGLAFSPNGEQLIAASEYGYLTLWNVSSGELTHTFTGHSDSVEGVAFAPDGQTILSASEDTTLILWDVTTGENLQTLRGHSDAVQAVTFSSDGQQALSASSDGTLILWDLVTGEALRVFTGHTRRVYGVAFSPDGQTALSAASDRTLILWNVQTGEALRTFTGHTLGVNGVALSPDGQTALSASEDGTLILWQVASGEALRTYRGHSDSVEHVTFSPDGQTALSASEDGTLILWQVASGEVLHRFSGHTDDVDGVAFSPNGRTAVSASEDGRLLLWDIEIGSVIATYFGHSDTVNTVALSPDERTALSGSEDGMLFLWDIANGDTLRTFTVPEGGVRGVAFAPQGTTALAASSDGTLILWDIATGEIVRTLSGHTNVVTDVVFSPDGQTAISSSSDTTLILWDVTTGEVLRTFRGHAEIVNSVDISPDGQMVLSASQDDTLILWNVETGSVIRRLLGHADHVLDGVFSPDGTTVLSASSDTSLILWDVATGTPLRTLSEHSDDVHAVAFSPDGRTALSAGEDTTLILWNIETGEAIRRLTGHTDDVRDVTFLLNGVAAISASDDGSLLRWRIDTLDALMAWTLANRSVRDLNCNERQQYHVQPLC